MKVELMTCSPANLLMLGVYVMLLKQNDQYSRPAGIVLEKIGSRQAALSFWFRQTHSIWWEVQWTCKSGFM
jgi:hypothetical protein